MVTEVNKGVADLKLGSEASSNRVSTVTEVNKGVADLKLGSEASSLYFVLLLIIISDVSLLGGLSTTALCLKDNVQTGASRVDGDVVVDSAAVRVDLRRLVVSAVEHFDVVERTATTRTHITRHVASVLSLTITIIKTVVNDNKTFSLTGSVAVTKIAANKQYMSEYLAKGREL